MKALSSERSSGKAHSPPRRSAMHPGGAGSQLPGVKGTKIAVAAKAGGRAATAEAPEKPATATEPIFAKPDPALKTSYEYVQPEPAEIKEIIMYGELAQLTYDSFRNKSQAAKVLSTLRPGDSGFEQRYKDDSMGHLTDLLQPNSLARKRGYKVIDFLYANSGWYFNDLERAVQDGIGDLLKKDGKDTSPQDKDLSTYLQEQYNWIGFVAISDPGKDGKRDIAIVIRGTITSTEWLADFDAVLIEADPWAKGTTVDGGKNAADQEPVDPNKSKMPNPKAARICRGFKKMYARPSEADPVNKRPPQEQIHEDLGGIFEDKKEKHRIGTITCAGHSLGAALATLAAYDLAHASCVPNNVKVRLCNFEGPKVGDDDFVANFKSLGIATDRIINVRDVVTSVPGLSPIALRQIYEALQQKREADEVGKTTDPDKVQSSIGKLLKGLGRHVALDVAGCVESMAAWKHNPLLGPLLGSFFHVADPVALDTSDERLAKLVKQPADFSGCHNLEMVLHMLDPTRDPCLINKGGDMLLGVPDSCKDWWAHSQNIVPPTCPASCHSRA